ncbi:MAG: S8 family serine peptidase [Ezakiella sp.]|uniref:S8 family serine peptidase n=1 Tax=Ezakiella sp. TaxID=1935205 RepID=UPI002A91354A|nr:S8 family serine peptidase [Ezakiella sp.]MDY6080559.1 S8 family serine peptidase [Ezakiella sp.]
MSKKFISILLSVMMVLSVFTGFGTIVRAEERNEYIINVDVEKLAPGFEKAYTTQNYDLALKLSDEALDKFEEVLKNELPNVEVFDRIELLVPALVAKMNAEELESAKSLPNVLEVFENYIINESDITRSNMAVFQDRGGLDESISMVNSNDLIGNDDIFQQKYDGRGRVLAIIDSNMDPTHSAFYLSPGVRPRLAKLDINNFLNGGKLSVKDNSADKKLYEDIYRSEKIPFGWNYNTNNKDLNPEKEKAAHGQHVSGTVAGNKFNISGKTWRGVAPEAQLLMMNVMRQGSTSSNIYIRAMQDAIVMGADAVNMSLGSTKGLPGQADGLVGKAINNGYAADTNFVIAAGNEGEYQGKLNIDNPDFGTMAAPGIATNAITVASLENKTMYVPLITFEGQKYIFQTGGELRFEPKDYEFVDCGLGKKEELEGQDLTGKVALMKRGGITFSEKVLNAQAANAAGAIIYNNVEGQLYMSVSGNSIPAISIELATAEKMLASSTRTVNIKMDPQETENPQFGELSSFTNWGLSVGGYMKPDITAPGGHIYSTETMGDTFGDMSGTSMATPHVTGGVGIIRDRLDDMMFAGEVHKAALTKTILMNSAIPHVDPKTKATTSPRRQGAGVMNLKKATELDFTAVDKDTKIASKFVGNVDDTITLNLLVHNYSGEMKELTPSVQATIEARDGKTLLLRPDELFSQTYEDKKFTVPAQTEQEFSITFPIEHLEKVEPFTNGAFVEGFLHLRDQNGMEISFPFVSFKGSYDNIPSIEKPVYDFDFTTEKPMYWNLKTRNHDWFKYSTHIETNYGTFKDEKGKTYNNVVIVGIKNFADIDENKNTDAEPAPEFEPIVLSPNADNYQDVLSINMVMVRTASVKASIIDSQGKSTDYQIGLKYTNISTDPDNDKNREQYLGFTSPGAVPLKDFEDGEYTLRLTAAAIKAPKESYPETYRDIKFTIDTVAPQFENAFYDEATRTLTFDIKEEGSGVREFKVTADEKAIDFTREGNKVTLVIPEGKELSDVNIYAIDNGHNIKEATAEMLVFKDMFGKLEVEVKQSGTEALNLEYKVVDEEGKEVKNTENLKFGKYKLIVTNYSNKFELKGESEIPFEISKENKEHKIVLEFTEIPTGRITIKVASKDNLEWADFTLLAKNVKTGKIFDFVQDEGIYDKYFDADLPYGDYEFYAEFKPGKDDYTITFSDDMPFTVNSSTNYSTVTANIKRSGFYKVHVTTEGTEAQIKYLAKDTKNGSIVGLDELAEGTWMIFPENMPEGMFVEKPYEYVTLTQEKPEANVTFTFEEIGDKKFTFTIKDNYENSDYYICDFYGWATNGKEGKAFDYEKGGIELTPGTYYVEAVADKERYGETTLTVDSQSYAQTSRTFRSTTDPVEVEFNWTKYSDSDKTSEGAIFVNDDNLPAELKKSSYEYILTGTKGEPMKKTFIKTGFSTWFVNLPYDYYKAEFTGLPEGYTVDTKEFIVNSNEYQVEFVIIPEGAAEEKVPVDVKFMKDGAEVTDVTFMLDDQEFTSGTIEVAPGTYDVEIVEPEGLVPTAEFETVTIDKDTKNLTIELEEGKPAPQGEGTIRFEVYEFDGTKETKLNKFMMAYANNEFIMGNEEKVLPYGKYEVKLSSTWNMGGLYDEAKSKITETVTLNDANKNAVVKFVLVLKNAGPGPEPQDPTKGKASWDINYTGTRTNLNFFEQVKLYKVVDGKDEEVKLSFEQEYKHGAIELEYGTYAYVLKDLSDYLKVNVKNKRIEFTLDKENPTYNAVFEIEDKKEVQVVEVRIPKDANESLKDYTITVFDMNGNEVEGVKMTEKGFEFPAVSGVDYELRLEGTKYSYYPNIINAYPSQTFSKYINIVAPLILKVNSLAGETEIEADYAVYAKTNYGVTYVTDLKKVPYISNGNQLYQVEFLGCEQGYKLKDEEIKEFTVTEYAKQELTFNFERDESVEVINKEELKKLVAEYDEIKNSDAYKNADENLKKAYDDAIIEAKAELQKSVTTQVAIDKLVEKVIEARDAVIGSKVEVVKEELKKLLDESQEIKNSDRYNYDNEEDKKAYDEAIENGQKVYDDENAVEKDVVKAIADIKAALKNLDGIHEADKAELKELLDQYNEVRHSDKFIYATEQERDEYETAIVDGTNIFNKREATQEEVDKAVEEIKRTYENLSGVVTPTEKSAKLEVEKAYVNDKYIRGTGTPGATVYYKVIGAATTLQKEELKDLIEAQKIGEDGKFSIDVVQIHKGDKIYVYQKEEGKSISEAVEVEIAPVDKTELQELVKEANELLDSKQFKYADETLKDNLKDAIENADKILRDDNASMDILKDQSDALKEAIENIRAFELKVFEVTFDPDNKEDKSVEKVEIGDKVTKPENPTKEGYTFEGWFNGDEKFDFDTEIIEDITLTARWKKIEVPTPDPDPTPDPTPDEPIIPDYPVIPDRPRPYRPTTPTVDIVKEPTKPVETTKPVEEKKDYGIVETMSTIAATFSDLPENEAAGSIMNMVARGILKGMDNGKFEGELPITRAMVATVLKRLSTNQKINDVQNFKDVKDKDWFAEAVKWAQSQGLIKGYEDGTFKANNLVTRQELAIIIERFLKNHGIAMEEIKELSYKDLDTLPAWSKDAIIAMAKIGLVEGQTEEIYNPASEFTREELAVMLEKIIIWVEKH